VKGSHHQHSGLARLGNEIIQQIEIAEFDIDEGGKWKKRPVSICPLPGAPVPLSTLARSSGGHEERKRRVFRILAKALAEPQGIEAEFDEIASAGRDCQAIAPGNGPDGQRASLVDPLPDFVTVLHAGAWCGRAFFVKRL
jgi:hypothetical protein